MIEIDKIERGTSLALGTRGRAGVSAAVDFALLRDHRRLARGEGGQGPRSGSSLKEKFRKLGDPSRSATITDAKKAGSWWYEGLKRVCGGNIPDEDEKAGCTK